MAWNFERTLSLGVSSPNDIVWDGRYLWSSSNSSITLVPYEVFDRSHYNDIALVAPVTGLAQQNEFLNPIDVSDYKVVSQSGYWIAPYQNGAFVSSGKSFSTITFIDSTLGQVTQTINCPATMNSNILVMGGKLWMTSFLTGGDQLYLYDIVAQSWSNSTIPATEQETLRHIGYDKSGFVLIPNFNASSICKYGLDGTYISTLQCTNKEPIYTYCDDNKNVVVASYNGMISVVDTTADTVTDWAYNGAGNDPQSNGIKDFYYTNFFGFASDGTYLWISTAGDALNRMLISDKSIVGTHVEEKTVIPNLLSTLPDGTIIPVVSPSTFMTDNGDGSFAEVTPTIANTMDENYTLVGPSGSYKKVLVIPQMTKQVWDGSSMVTKTYAQQIALATSSGLYVMPNSGLWRSNFVSVNCVAMISSGPNNYTGE